MNILFVFGHPDDEAFGPAGTIAKLAEEHSVWVMSCCKGDRPGSEHVSGPRQTAFVNSCESLGATPIIYNSSDLHLDYHTALRDIEETIREVKPEVVYTHNISDIHKDHRLVAEAVMAACRPTLYSRIKELYMCEIPASTDWTFGQIQPVFTPNVYKDVTDYIIKKRTALSFYRTELHEYPDARSVGSMEALAMNRGRQVGCAYAEAFQLVFAHDRRNP
jgi:LmbE family N-acetylglucosaminyl deacetylase